MMKTDNHHMRKRSKMIWIEKLSKKKRRIIALESNRMSVPEIKESKLQIRSSDVNLGLIQ